MSILDTLFGGLFGTDDQDQQQETVVERPCSNCPGYCSIAPNACSVCQPYKEQMIDAIYWVEHKEELLSRYEVIGASGTQNGAVTCPHCGGHSEDPYVCEYCGSRLQEGNGKIKVASAADIPNPVMEAQEIIFQRYEAVKGFEGADEAYGLVDALSGVESEGLLSSIFNALLGSGDTNDSRTLGNRMSESEIEEMADYYKVSVSDYLTGLDNGKYLTLSNKKIAAKAEEQYANSSSGSQTGSSMSSLAGLAGLTGLTGLTGLFGGSSYNYSAARPTTVPRPTVVVQKPSSTQSAAQVYTKPHASHLPKPSASASSSATIKPGSPAAEQLYHESIKPSKPANAQSKPKTPEPEHHSGALPPRPSTVQTGASLNQTKPSSVQPRPQAQGTDHHAGSLPPRPSASQPRPSSSQKKPSSDFTAKTPDRPGAGPQQDDKVSNHPRPAQSKAAQKVPKKGSSDGKRP